ncbi:unnamed protein product [Notodromas monacha]|uniref:DUF4200 domain-containing protein n=1 Tax=Notodromas monacha TaxID=399045 RepID=A0A7R9BQ55_9CRUS|nr:unnamed protein product [Notodromas monacha]CAG0919588.1 unnamed protein product [Notodromas monacha]
MSSSDLSIVTGKVDSAAKVREHVSADVELQEQRKLYQLHQERVTICSAKLEERRRNLEEKQARYDKHIQDGKERCAAARRRAKNEIEVIEQKQVEITAMLEELTDVKEELRRRKEDAEKFVLYQDFLQGAVDASGGEFSSMQDLLSRYCIMLQTKKDLEFQLKRVQNEIATLRNGTMLLQQSHSTDLLRIGNEITDLQKQFLHTHECVINLEESLEDLRSNRRETVATEGTLKLATNNVYRILMRYRQKAGLSSGSRDIIQDSNLCDQLQKIGEYIDDFRAVVHVVRAERDIIRDDGSSQAMRGSIAPMLV